MENILDVVIIGSGPAGLTAAIYASRAELKGIVIEKSSMSGGQIINTYEVDNYPGIPGISGFELANRFREHCDGLGMDFYEGEVKGLSVDENRIKTITLEDGTEFKTKTVIIAGGVKNRKLEVPGEEELAGMGVSYCATCDGAFFKGKRVAVVGGGDVAVEDAIFLARLAEKVYVIHRRDEFRAARSLIRRLMEMENVEIIWDSVVEQIEGDDMVTGMRIANKKTGEKSELSLDGVFVAVGNMPLSQNYADVVELDESGYIKATEDCQTSVPGIYAAGDIRTKPLKQIITAAADGANAITAVEKYLNEMPGSF
ncbi:MAG: thioredoxin-disulfide reductase [Acetivibrio ethanolgignens]